jgi:Uma2 family endonuclease
MATQTEQERQDLLYPDSDGKPTADNTLQFQWIMTLQGNLSAMYRHQEDVFVAGDLLWYAVEGDPSACVAPDTLVVFGRPRGDRGSYQQWREGGTAPQVVFEVLSPSNTDEEMERKLEFYDEHGVEEYYLYDPDSAQLSGWWRRRGKLRPVSRMHGRVSPRLGIRFDLSGPELVIYKPNGDRFLTFEELAARDEETAQRIEEERRRREEAERRAQQAEQAAQEERRLREQSDRAAEEERQRNERLAARLRELGQDPDV